MKILVTGSRTWDDYRLIWERLNHHSQRDEINILIHGAARGADLIASRAAEALSFDRIDAYPADWDRYGKRAGYVRNSEMVALIPDICLAFIMDESRGATMCAEIAEKRGVPVEIHRASSRPQ